MGENIRGVVGSFGCCLSPCSSWMGYEAYELMCIIGAAYFIYKIHIIIIGGPARRGDFDRKMEIK